MHMPAAAVGHIAFPPHNFPNCATLVQCLDCLCATGANLQHLLTRKPCLTWQAERLQQYRDKIAQESGAALACAPLWAQSDLGQLVDQVSQEEKAQQDKQARSVTSPGALQFW